MRTPPRGKRLPPLPPMKARGFHELPPDPDELPPSSQPPSRWVIDWDDPAEDVDHNGGLV